MTKPVASAALDSARAERRFSLLLVLLLLATGCQCTGLATLQVTPRTDGPTDLTAVARSPRQVALDWKDNSSEELSYVVERGLSPDAGSLAELTTLPADSSSFLDDTVTPGTTYLYRVTGLFPGGQRASTDVVSVTPAGDGTPPTVTIQLPTTAPTWTTSQPTIDLSGVASDDTGVVAVHWANVSGGQGTATGTEQWTATGIALFAGENQLTVTAEDAAGNLGSATLTVTLNPQCQYGLSAAGATFDALGGTGTVTVTSSAGCAWTAASNDAWLSVTSGSSGSGTGVVTFAVAPNTSTTPRTGTLTIAGQPFEVTQGGAGCSPLITPTIESFSSAAATGSVTVTVAPGCAWTAVANDAWLSVTTGASGTGNGTVSYQVAANPGATVRVGTLTIAGQVLTVTQAGACSFALSPTSQALPPSASSGTVSVTTGGGCAWTATTTTPWLSITSGVSGTGSGTVTFQATANTGSASRTGDLTIGGQTFTVTQAGACSYTLVPGSQSFAATGGTGSVTITTTAACAWSVTSSAAWLTVTSGTSGLGSGSTSFSVAANTSSAARSATLTIGGQVFTVTQAGACSYALAPTSANVASTASTATVAVTTDATCAWTATSNAAWLTVTSGASGTGNGTVGYSVAANPSASGRSGTLTIAGQTFTVFQAGLSCTYALTPTSQTAVSGASTGTVAVAAAAGCTWTASANVAWLTVTSGTPGTGNGTVGYSVAANPSTAGRTGTLTVAGQTFTVTQAGLPCSYAIAPTSQAAVSGASSGNVGVTAGAGCAWTAVSNAAWLTVTSGTPGTGNGTVGYSVAANTGTGSRTGTLSIAGQTFTVTQAGLPCSYSLSLTLQSFTAAAGTGTVGVTAGTGCTWTAVANDAWLTVTSGTPGTGNGTVGYSVAANTTTASRTGTLTIAGQTFTVTQAGISCSFSIAPTSQTAGAGASTGTVSVTATAGCGWTAAANVAWLTVTSGTPGSGNGTVGYSVAANGGSTSRTGTLTIAGQTFTVTQAAPCTYAIAPPSQTLSSGATTGTVTVTAGAGCAWTATSNDGWLTVTSGSAGTGNGTVGYSVAANTLGVSRTGTLTIAGQTFTVTQSAACGYSIAPTSQAAGAAASTGTVAVTAGAGCAWTAVSNDAWLTVTSGASGSGNGSVGYSVAANAGTASRTGTLTIGGQTFTVTQAGTCSYSIAPASQSAPAGATTGTVTVTSGTGCAWTASSGAAWLTITSGASGTGNGSVAWSATANAGASSRVGTLTIAGQTFTLTQAGTSGSTVIASFGARGEDQGKFIGVDRTSGNVFVFGSYQNTVDFSGGTGTALTATSGSALFLAKFSPTLGHLWSKSLEASVSQEPGGLAVNQVNGNVVVTGILWGTLTLSAPCTNLTGSGVPYLIEYSPAGACVWAKTIDGGNVTAGNGVAVDGAGDVYVTGSFNGTVTFATGSTCTNLGYEDVFVAKYGGAAGAFAWRLCGGGASTDVGMAIAADTTNVAVTGRFYTSATFGGTTVTVPAPNGMPDIFLLELNAATGAVRWAKDLGGTEYDVGTTVGLDATGNVIVGGESASTTATFGGPSVITNHGLSDLFLGKYAAANGAFMWAKLLGGTESDVFIGPSLAIDPSDNILVTGTIRLSADLGGPAVTSAGMDDVFLARYQSNGTWLYSKSFGGTLNDAGFCVASDASGHAWLTGYYTGQATFDTTVLGSTANTDRDIFLLEISTF